MVLIVNIVLSSVGLVCTLQSYSTFIVLLKVIFVMKYIDDEQTL